MRSRIPASHRLRHLLFYSRRLASYNLAISAIAATAITLVAAAGLLGDALGDPDWRQETRGALIVMGLLIATVGHWIAVIVTGLVHHGEQALYRGGGWSMGELWFASWLLSIAVGAAIVVMVGL